jgi:hypothetical protein
MIKPKQQKVIDKMQKTRYNDYVNIREIIKQKLIWIPEEIKKGINAIEVYKKEIEKINQKIRNLQIAELTLKDVLKETDKKDNISPDKAENK